MIKKIVSYVILDDIHERRWKIIFKSYQAFKVTAMDYANLNFMKGDDFDDTCFEEKEGYPVPQFRKHNMEFQDSNWIAKIKKSVRKDSKSANIIGKARHFLIP